MLISLQESKGYIPEYLVSYYERILNNYKDLLENYYINNRLISEDVNYQDEFEKWNEFAGEIVDDYTHILSQPNGQKKIKIDEWEKKFENIIVLGEPIIKHLSDASQIKTFTDMIAMIKKIQENIKIIATAKPSLFKAGLNFATAVASALLHPVKTVSAVDTGVKDVVETVKTAVKKEFPDEYSFIKSKIFGDLMSGYQIATTEILSQMNPIFFERAEIDKSFSKTDIQRSNAVLNSLVSFYLFFRETTQMFRYKDDFTFEIGIKNVDISSLDVFEQELVYFSKIVNENHTRQDEKNKKYRQTLVTCFFKSMIEFLISKHFKSLNYKSFDILDGKREIATNDYNYIMFRSNLISKEAVSTLYDLYIELVSICGLFSVKDKSFANLIKQNGKEINNFRDISMVKSIVSSKIIPLTGDPTKVYNEFIRNTKSNENKIKEIMEEISRKSGEMLEEVNFYTKNRTGISKFFDSTVFPSIFTLNAQNKEKESQVRGVIYDKSNKQLVLVFVKYLESDSYKDILNGDWNFNNWVKFVNAHSEGKGLEDFVDTIEEPKKAEQTESEPTDNKTDTDVTEPEKKPDTKEETIGFTQGMNDIFEKGLKKTKVFEALKLGDKDVAESIKKIFKPALINKE